MPVYQPDIFDSVSSSGTHRTGAHRSLGRLHSLWAKVVVFVLLLLVVVVFASFFMRILDGNLRFFAAADSVAATPTPTALQKQAYQLTIYNGTDINGYAAAVSKMLIGNGWNVQSATNAEKKGVTNTQIYVFSDADKQAGDAVASILHGGDVVVDSARAQSGKVVVLLGTDVYSNLPGIS